MYITGLRGILQWKGLEDYSDMQSQISGQISIRFTNYSRYFNPHGAVSRKCHNNRNQRWAKLKINTNWNLPFKNYARKIICWFQSCHFLQNKLDCVVIQSYFELLVWCHEIWEWTYQSKWLSSELDGNRKWKVTGHSSLNFRRLLGKKDSK